MPRRDKKVVLVVDDNQDAADTLALIVRYRGHDVHVAYDSMTGLALAGTLMPDIIFHDIAMPAPNGYAVAAQLKSDPLFSNTLLVAVTAYNRTSDLHESARAGFDVHMSKPVELDMLDAVLHKVGG
jgi:CheY-like chemotaxis protein